MMESSFGGDMLIAVSFPCRAYAASYTTFHYQFKLRTRLYNG